MNKKQLPLSCEDCQHLKVKIPVSNFIKYEEVIEDKIDYDTCVVRCSLEGLTRLDQTTPKLFRLGARLKANVKNYSKKQIYKDWTMANMCPSFVKADLRDLLKLIRWAKRFYEISEERQNKFKREEKKIE